MVKIQANMIDLATPQRTADIRLAEPTPIIAPVMVWVVETGIPPREAPINVAAPANSAHDPPTGLSCVIRIDIVLTMRHPPTSVPNPRAALHIKIIQNGICVPER
jgi:hypothetical protein